MKKNNDDSSKNFLNIPKSIDELRNKVLTIDFYQKNRYKTVYKKKHNEKYEQSFEENFEIENKKLQKIISKAKKNEPLISKNIFDKDALHSEKSEQEIDLLHSKKKSEIKDLQFGVNQYFLKTSTISKIKNGLMHIDQIIDLHHMKLQDAYLFLISNLENAYKNEKRMILVITGKGYGNGFFKSERNFDETDFSDKTIIRNNIIDWINNSNFLINITLYINFAQEKHGGHGAFYLYLKF